MTTQDFTTSITVDQTPDEAFAAICEPRGWWSRAIEGTTDKVGGEWTYRYGADHTCKMRVTALVPGKNVVWRVLENRFSFTKDKSEWVGNEISFDISKKGNKTEIRFTQVGLVPEYECYDICSTAWTSYVKGSLRNLITKGKGQPNPKE